MKLKSTTRQSLLGEPSLVELRKVVNDLVSDVKALRLALEDVGGRNEALRGELEDAKRRIAALEAPE